MFIFSIWGLIANFFTYPVFELLFIIHTSGIFAGLFYNAKKDKLKELLKISKTTIITGITLVSDIFFLILAYRQINIASAISLHYLAPLLIPAISIFFIKEKINLKTYIPIALIGLLGTILISFKYYSFDGLGIFYGIMSGITLALIIVLQKKNLENKSPTILIFQYSLVEACVDLTLGLIFNQIHLKFTLNLLLLFLIGFAMRQGSIMYSYGLKHLKLEIASILAYSEVGISALYGYLFLHQIITIYEFFGILLIILSGALIIFKKVDNETIKEEL